MNTITTDNDAIIFNGERYVKEPTYDRQVCLRGEWRPRLDEKFYYIHPKTPKEINKGFNNLQLGQYDPGCKFFPTEADAVEYKKIAEGEWLPKKGDAVWLIGNPRWRDGTTAGFDYKKCKEKYFPSAEQRDAYIAKHKPKLRDGLRTPEEGQKYFGVGYAGLSTSIWSGCHYDNEALALGNVFLNRENAKRILEQRQIMARLHKWIDENDARPEKYRVTGLGRLVVNELKFDAFNTACKPDLDRWYEIESELQVSLYE